MKKKSYKGHVKILNKEFLINSFISALEQEKTKWDVHHQWQRNAWQVIKRSVGFIRIEKTTENNCKIILFPTIGFDQDENKIEFPISYATYVMLKQKYFKGIIPDYKYLKRLGVNEKEINEEKKQLNVFSKHINSEIMGFITLINGQRMLSKRQMNYILQTGKFPKRSILNIFSLLMRSHIIKKNAEQNKSTGNENNLEFNYQISAAVLNDEPQTLNQLKIRLFILAHDIKQRSSRHERSSLSNKEHLIEALDEIKEKSSELYNLLKSI